VNASVKQGSGPGSALTRQDTGLGHQDPVSVFGGLGIPGMDLSSDFRQQAAPDFNVPRVMDLGEYFSQRASANRGELGSINDLTAFLRNHCWKCPDTARQEIEEAFPYDGESSLVAHDAKLGLALLAKEYRAEGNISALRALEAAMAYAPLEGLTPQDMERIFPPGYESSAPARAQRPDHFIPGGLLGRTALNYIALGSHEMYSLELQSARQKEMSPSEAQAVERAAPLAYLDGLFRRYEGHRNAAEVRFELSQVPPAFLEEAYRELATIHNRDQRLRVSGGDRDLERVYRDFGAVVGDCVAQRREEAASRDTRHAADTTLALAQQRAEQLLGWYHDGVTGPRLREILGAISTAQLREALPFIPSEDRVLKRSLERYVAAREKCDQWFHDYQRYEGAVDINFQRARVSVEEFRAVRAIARELASYSPNDRQLGAFAELLEHSKHPKESLA
jgi:hypothetical protein